MKYINYDGPVVNGGDLRYGNTTMVAWMIPSFAMAAREAVTAESIFLFLNRYMADTLTVNGSSSEAR